MKVTRFNTEEAKEYGINEAIIIEYIRCWISHNKKKKLNFIEEKTWMYNTYSEMASQFSFMNETQVRYALKKLINSGILITGNYNKFKYDRTTWYAFADEEKFLV